MTQDELIEMALQAEIWNYRDFRLEAFAKLVAEKAIKEALANHIEDNKTRANTAEHAAEAIEFLLAECDALHKETEPESAYQRGYLDGIGRECPHCKDYKAMYIKVRDELAAEQQITQQQTALIVDLQTHIENLEGEG